MESRCINCGRRIAYVEAHPVVAKQTGEPGYWFHPKGNTVWCYSGIVSRSIKEQAFRAEPTPVPA